MQVENCPGKKNSKCKGPEAETCYEFARTSKEASVSGSERENSKK